ncbi:tyrosine--tRNA ligase, partial [Pseudomonas aeruginosa]
HVGHLQGLMLMRWLQKAGHRPLLLIGGATTRIGDPSFRDSSRPILTEAQIQANIDGIARVFSRYVELHDDSLVNNAEWLDGVGYLEFLDRVGRHFSINRLLTFDAIRQRLDREHSLSFLEFGYTLL